MQNSKENTTQSSSLRHQQQSRSALREQRSHRKNIAMITKQQQENKCHMIDGPATCNILKEEGAKEFHEEEGEGGGKKKNRQEVEKTSTPTSVGQLYTHVLEDIPSSMEGLKKLKKEILMLLQSQEEDKKRKLKEGEAFHTKGGVEDEPQQHQVRKKQFSQNQIPVCQQQPSVVIVVEEVQPKKQPRAFCASSAPTSGLFQPSLSNSTSVAPPPCSGGTPQRCRTKQLQTTSPKMATHHPNRPMTPLGTRSNNAPVNSNTTTPVRNHHHHHHHQPEQQCPKLSTTIHSALATSSKIKAPIIRSKTPTLKRGNEYQSSSEGGGRIVRWRKKGQQQAYDKLDDDGATTAFAHSDSMATTITNTLSVSPSTNDEDYEEGGRLSSIPSSSLASSTERNSSEERTTKNLSSISEAEEEEEEGERRYLRDDHLHTNKRSNATTGTTMSSCSSGASRSLSSERTSSDGSCASSSDWRILQPPQPVVTNMESESSMISTSATPCLRDSSVRSSKSPSPQQHIPTPHSSKKNASVFAPEAPNLSSRAMMTLKSHQDYHQRGANHFNPPDQGVALQTKDLGFEVKNSTTKKMKIDALDENQLQLKNEVIQQQESMIQELTKLLDESEENTETAENQIELLELQIEEQEKRNELLATHQDDSSFSFTTSSSLFFASFFAKNFSASSSGSMLACLSNSSSHEKKEDERSTIEEERGKHAELLLLQEERNTRRDIADLEQMTFLSSIYYPCRDGARQHCLKLLMLKQEGREEEVEKERKQSRTSQPKNGEQRRASQQFGGGDNVHHCDDRSSSPLDIVESSSPKKSTPLIPSTSLLLEKFLSQQEEEGSQSAEEVVHCHAAPKSSFLSPEELCEIVMVLIDQNQALSKRLIQLEEKKH